MLKCLSFQFFIFGFFMMFNSFIFANDIVPRPYEKAKIGQWVLLRHDEFTIKSVIMDIGFANGELVYIVFRNEINNLNNNEIPVPQYVFRWGDDILPYSVQDYLPQELQEEVITKISGQINEKHITKWIIALQGKDISEFRYALYPEIIGGLVIDHEFQKDLSDNTFDNVSKIDSLEIIDFGDDYNLDECTVPPFNGVEMDDVFLVDPKIGQWVEVVTYGRLNNDQKYFIEKLRASIINIENSNNDEIIVVEESRMNKDNSIFNRKIKKYNQEYIFKKNVGYKMFFRFNDWHIDSFEGDINGKIFKGYLILYKSMPDNEIIMSKDIPITGFVSDKNIMREISTTDFSQLKDKEVNGK